MALKFYICETCGKIVEVVKETAVPTICCGKEMKELVPCSTDGAHEKHVPVVSVEECKVTVCIGEAAHPMMDAHYIEWVAIETKQGMQKKQLKPGDEPKACFKLCCDDEVIAAYAYCNLHGLWKKEL